MRQARITLVQSEIGGWAVTAEGPDGVVNLSIDHSHSNGRTPRAGDRVRYSPPTFLGFADDERRPQTP